MKKTVLLTLAMVFSLNLIDKACSQTRPQAQRATLKYDKQKLATLAIESRKSTQTKLQAAMQAGFRMSFTVKSDNKGAGDIEGPGYFAKLHSITADGRPVYYRTLNAAAAISTRTNLLHGTSGLGLNLTGKDLVAYVWDGGTARITHQEFGNRLSIGDSDTGYLGISSDHATHVAGTMIATGIDPDAKGMAPEASGKTFDWDFDRSEAIVEAANGMLVSNHSYGFMFRDPNTGAVLLPNSYFGGYLNEARAWDEVMFNAPKYLMVVAAGNDGQDNSANTSPLGGNGSFDKLTGHCTCKNNLVVANVRDVSTNAMGNITITVQKTPSSSEGPTDDLRIKPDISGNGFELKSTVHLGAAGNTNDKYQQNGWTGTSMASPNVSGSLLLLQELYERKNSDFMRSATLKGLAIHTADDIGPPGPDAEFGWGLMNAKFAAQTILKSVNSSAILLEAELADGTPFRKKFKARGNVRATICWTDPAGQATPESVVNNTAAVLVNDLNLRLSRRGQTLMPWKLTSVNSNTTGNNTVDPVERIDDTISTDSEIEYEITISHANTITNGPQEFSLIVTGDSLDAQSSEGQSDAPNTEEIKQIRTQIENMIQELEDVLQRLDRVSDNSVPSDTIGSASAIMLAEFKNLKKQDFPDQSVTRLRELLDSIKTNPKAYGVPEKGESRPRMGIPPNIGKPAK